MTMICPATYVEMRKDKSFPELIEDRNELISLIGELEEIVLEKDKSSEKWERYIEPDVQYQVNLEYLAALCEFMRDKYNKEYVWDSNNEEEE